jgi:hypothetical protein
MQTFTDQYCDLKKSSGRIGITFWLAALVDEIAGIMRERTTWLREGKGFLRITGWKVVLSGLLLVPLYVASYAALVKISLALPHPVASGIGFLLALAFLLLCPAAFSMVVSYLLASTLVSILPTAKSGRS